MAEYFRKTERGRREVRERSLNLSRTARNLLLILDSSKSLTAWIDMIQGATLADAVALLEAGLIESPPVADDRPAQFEPTEPMGHTGWQVPSQYAGLRDPAGRPARQPGPTAAVPNAPGTLTTPATSPRPAAAPVGARATSGLASEPMGLDRLGGAARSPGGPSTLPPGLSGRGDTTPGGLDPLSRPAGLSGPSSRPPSDFAGLDTSPMPEGTRNLGYTELYDSLNALLRESLGLFRGYRYTLRIEKAQNLAELEQVARDFIDEVQRVRGESMARMVQRALGLGG